MSGKIHILKADLANKIAAGEVIQRPASAVKELLENSIDAGARSITILIKDAGKSLIQVIDDGEGMFEEDALLSFKRHSTSKIHSIEDLENIQTLGFRGEALASIAAVAQVELRSRTNSNDTAILLRIDGSELLESTQISAPPGTSISAKNLFFNTPARRQFLKTDATELRNITEIITRIALVYPEIGFKYSHNGLMIFDIPKSNLADRVRSVVGEHLFRELIFVREKSEDLEVTGYVGKPGFFRRSRTEQYLYLNRRYIVNKAINHAVFKAYEHLLEKGSFPFFFLNISIDPKKIDVNVHPSKLEVKFADESRVYRFVLAAINKTFGTHDLSPTLEKGTIDRPPFSVKRVSSDIFPVTERSSPGEEIDQDGLFNLRSSQSGRGSEPEGVAISSFEPLEGVRLRRSVVLQHRTSGIVEGEKEDHESKAIWQLHNKYILSQVRTGIIVIDQHVAHERILYERAIASFENKLPVTQQLLFPQTVELNPVDYQLAEELIPQLQCLGFGIKLFGRNTIVIEGIPADVRVGNERTILQDILNEYRKNEHQVKMDVRDRLAKSYACKAAIKAGDKLSVPEMVNLIDQLFATKMPYVCPHGRPVVVRVTIEELDKRFGRI